MSKYIQTGKFPVEKYFSIATEEFKIDNTKYPDNISFYELFIYKNHYQIPSLTEKFIDDKKCKEINQAKLLDAMNNSIVGLFKIIDCDTINGL